MAMVVPWASCFGQCSIQPVQLSLVVYHGPRTSPQPRLACRDPNMTLRQICRMLKVMRQVKNREAALANSRKQVSAVPVPASPCKSDNKKCAPVYFRRRRNSSVKRVG